MSLRASAQSVPQRGSVPICGVAKLRTVLTKDDLAWLDEHLANDWDTSTYIARVLKIEGHHLSDFTIRRHRTGRCSCVPA